MTMATQEVRPSYETTATDSRSEVVDDRRKTQAVMPTWSPAQIVGLIVGIGFAVLGIAAVARTGFDTDHIYTPHDTVWNLPHSPLLGVIEIGFGVLMVLSSVVPGGIRTLMGLLGAASLAFGLVVLIAAAPNRLNNWLAVTDRSGWLFTIVGTVVVIAALFSPVFVGGARREVVRDERVSH
jgi:hypothetical protein